MIGNSVQQQRKQDSNGFLNRLREHDRIVVLAIALAVAAASIIVFTALGIFSSRAAADRELRAALTVENDLEVMLAVHMAANTDFLKGVGVASYGSLAWPVARASKAAAIYNRLEYAFAAVPDDYAAVRKARRLTAFWSMQLENAAHHTVGKGSRVAVDSAELLAANESLRAVADILASLRRRQEARVASMQIESQRRLVHERLALSLATIAAVFFLTYGFLATHRGSLARSRVRVVAAEAESRFREYFEQHPLAMMIYDVDTLEILTTNEAAQDQYKYSRDGFANLSMTDLRPDSDVPGFLSDLRTYRHGSRGGSAGIRRHLRRDGVVIAVQVSFHFLSYAGREACFITAVEVTEHEEAKRELRLRGRALDASSNAVLITCPVADGDRVQYANPAFERITGYSRHEAMGRDSGFLLGQDQNQPGAADIRAALRSSTEGSALLRSYRRDGTLFWNQLHVAPVFDDSGIATHHICVFSDASDIVDSQEQLRRQAREDALTSLPNRFGLAFALHEMLARAEAESETIALAFIDLDNFKDINDSMGHNAGDRVLQEISLRLCAALDRNDIVARYGGDEFVVLLYGSGQPGSAERRLAGFEASLSEPLTMDSSHLHIETSVGLACYPQDGTDAETLLRNADTALHRAKSEGRNRIVRFEPSLARATAERLSLSARLRGALERGEFELYYQPQVSLATGRLMGVEALLRWHDPQHGLVSPASFLPRAEESGLVVPIGEWILEQACLQGKHWSLEQRGIRVGVNVSPVQFSRTDLPATVARALELSGLDPRSLEIEITESALMDPSTLPLLHTVRAMGVAVAIDDFGVGYSSLAYVRNFTADTLKIDMSFVRGIGRSAKDEAIVKAILGLGHTLGMKVVAEGVETATQRDFLILHQCDEVQGYWYGRPVPAAQITPLITGVNTAARPVHETPS